MTRGVGSPARGPPRWMDADPPGVGGNPVLIDLPDDETTLTEYVDLDENLSVNHELGDFAEERR